MDHEFEKSLSEREKVELSVLSIESLIHEFRRSPGVGPLRPEDELFTRLDDQANIFSI